MRPLAGRLGIVLMDWQFAVRIGRGTMRLSIDMLFVAAFLALVPGCDSLIGLVAPNTTSVRLVNSGDFAIEVVLYIDDKQEIPRALLTELGTRLEFRIAPGERTTFSRECDDLQAIVIDDADLLVIGQVGPEANTDVLRDGDDFRCGDAIVFTFDHSLVLVDFDVTVFVQGS